jgi:hypothetical protein
MSPRTDTPRREAIVIPFPPERVVRAHYLAAWLELAQIFLEASEAKMAKPRAGKQPTPPRTPK